MSYTIRRADTPPALNADWDSPAWRQAETAAITHFHPRSSNHRPDVRARVLYDEAGLYVMFRAEDRYVLARHTDYQDPVATDSCVEFFVQPDPNQGYFNFEVNAIGTMLLYYITEPEKMLDGGVPVPSDLAETIRVHTSLDGPITDEITEPVIYTVAYFVPWPVFEQYVGPVSPEAATQWRGNFYKCADATSHPHWGAWAPIGDKLSFHQPGVFGTLRFEETAP
jgi:hypothetical protein